MFGWLTTLLNALATQPPLLLAVVALPVLVIMIFAKIYPTRQLVTFMIVPALTSLGLLVKQDLLPLILVIDVVLALFFIADVFSIPRPGAIAVERSCRRIGSLRKNHPVTLTITNLSRRAISLMVRDDIPEEFSATPDEFTLSLPARSRAVVHYDLVASRRGAFQLDCTYVRIASRLGFWHAYRKPACASVIHVYPDMQQLSKYAILARTNHLSLMGVRRTRRVGQDNEFERLRDYSVDDNFKHIDWRSTARRNKLTVRDFQTNQSQRLIFLVDCGRMMTNLSEGLSLLDHALNSMLMLSYVALRQGDAVGMIGFSDRIVAYVPPKGGMTQMNHLLHASFDRFPELVESRYDQAFMHLSRFCLKRSLVVLLTNVIDEVNASQVYRYLSTLVGRHLPVGVLLRDHRLFDYADQKPLNEDELFRNAAAADILIWRQQVITDLEHRGVLSVDTFPEGLTAPLVNKYLEIKARHLL